MEPAPPPTLLETFAGLPVWVHVIGAALTFALACWLFARAFRILAALLAVAVIAVASAIAWQHVFG